MRQATAVAAASHLLKILSHSQIPAGFLADKYGGAGVITLGLVTWSLANALVPLAAGSLAPLTALLVARLLLGLAQASGQPSMAAVCARWGSRQQGIVPRV